MQNHQTASFTMAGLTVETLQVLAKEEDYANLVALYVCYLEISIWQKNDSVRATNEFVMKRLKWGKNKLFKAKKRLTELDLVKPIIRKNDDGKIVNHYVLVRHVVHSASKPPVWNNDSVENDDTSTTNLHKSTTNLHKVLTQQGAENSESTLFPFDEEGMSESECPPQYRAAPPHETLMVKKQKLLEIVNKTCNRSFRVLPERGTKKTLDAFSLEEIETALKALAKDEWHKDMLKDKNLSIDYLTRSTTIDRWLGIAKKARMLDKRIYG